MAADNGGALPDSALRGALEFAVSAAASQAGSLPPGVAALRAFRRTPVLDKAQLAKVRRIVEADDDLRRALGERAPAAVVDEVGRNWLRAATVPVRPAGRSGAHRRAAKSDQIRRAAAGGEKSVRDETRADEHLALHEELSAIVAELAEVRRQLGAAQRAAAASERASATAKSEAQRWQQRAEDLAESLAEAASSRDRLLGELAWHTDDAERFADQPEVRGVRRLAAPRRTPIPVPGGLRREAPAAVEHVLRAEGAVVLVDGYNVAKLGWPDLTLEQQRAALVDALAAMSRRLGVVLSVIFDGADVTAPSARAQLVPVRFSEPGVSADDEIRARVASLPAQRPVVVITDDREVVNDVTRLGANTVPSAALLALRR